MNEIFQFVMILILLRKILLISVNNSEIFSFHNSSNSNSQHFISHLSLLEDPLMIIQMVDEIQLQ